MFLNGSTCFGRHTTDHQELKNCNCSLWFYIRFWSPVAATVAQPSQRKCFKIAQRVSGDTPSIIRSSKTLIAASGFTNVYGCRSLRTATINVCKTRGYNYSFELLMMCGVSPEICWAIKKHWNNKFYYTVASCWFFLRDLYYDARIYEH
jgi:hypothetical protein